MVTISLVDIDIDCNNIHYSFWSTINSFSFFLNVSPFFSQLVRSELDAVQVDEALKIDYNAFLF